MRPSTLRQARAPRRAASVKAIATALALLSGCACDTVPDDAVTKCSAEITVGGGATDILFVIDESLSMQQEQETLRDNLDDFVTTLAGSPVKNDFRIGVTTTSVTNYDPASVVYLQGPNACAAPTCAPFPRGALVAIERDGAGAPVPYKLWYDAGTWKGPRWIDDESPTLVQDFQANVLLGTSGSGKEQPLRAARLALSDRIQDGTNAGFLRAGAKLAIVFLTDEDDCSDTAGVIPTTSSAGQTACSDSARKLEPGRLDSIDEFVAFLTGPIDGEARDPKVAVIAGFNATSLDPTPRCADAFDAPERMDALIQALGSSALKDSICNPSFADSLQAIADLLVPQSVPLEGAVPDYRMLVVSVERNGAVIGCPVALVGTPEVATAGTVYAPPAGSTPATLSFQNMCVLKAQDRVDVRILCAG